MPMESMAVLLIRLGEGVCNRISNRRRHVLTDTAETWMGSAGVTAG